MLEAARLEREIAGLAQEQALCQSRIRQLMEQEAAGQSGLAAAIHQAKQRRMMLATQAQHLKARLNALLMGGT